MLQLLAPPPTGYAPRNVLRQLERIEQLPVQTSGAYLVRDGEQVCGTICVERGRVCWAAARGLASRLTDRLCEVEKNPERRDALHHLYRRCMSEQLPLGATLVKSQVVTEEVWREALTQHTAESLLQLSPFLSRVPAWLGHDSGTYQSDFALDGVEVAAGIGALLHHRSKQLAAVEFGQVLPRDVFAAAFVWPQEEIDHFPVFASKSHDHSVASVLDLGRWGHQQLQLLHVVVERCQVVTGIFERSQAVVCWNYDAGYCVALCNDGKQMARLLSNLSRRGK